MVNPIRIVYVLAGYHTNIINAIVCAFLYLLPLHDPKGVPSLMKIAMGDADIMYEDIFFYVYAAITDIQAETAISG